MRADRERLQDILQAIQEIEAYKLQGKRSFEQNKLLQSGILYQLIIIGEATGDINSTLRDKYAYIPWKNIIGMRDILAHQYFKIDLKLVWLTIDQKLPELKITIQSMLKDLENESRN
jgi:uncharacterized protein with HEPN domain